MRNTTVEATAASTGKNEERLCNFPQITSPEPGNSQGNLVSGRGLFEWEINPTPQPRVVVVVDVGEKTSLKKIIFINVLKPEKERYRIGFF